MKIQGNQPNNICARMNFKQMTVPLMGQESTSRPLLTKDTQFRYNEFIRIFGSYCTCFVENVAQWASFGMKLLEVAIQVDQLPEPFITNCAPKTFFLFRTFLVIFKC